MDIDTLEMLLINNNKSVYHRILNFKRQNNTIKKEDDKLFLDEGTLIHGVEFDIDILKSISDNGLIAPDFIENAKTSNGNSKKVVLFYRVPNGQTMANYSDFCNKKFSWSEYEEIKDIENFAVSRHFRAEREFLPNEKTNKNNIAFIINPCEEVHELLKYDAFKERNKKLLDSGVIEKFHNVPDRIATLVYGIPPNMISGIWVSNAIKNDKEKINQLMKLFPDKYITTSEGEIISEPQKENKQKTKEDENDNTIRNNVLSHKTKLGIGNLQRDIKQGNTGEMHRYIASDGSKYLVKPAYKKNSKDVEPYRAFIQRAAYDVQKIIDSKSAVACNVKKIEIDGQEVLGSVQEEIEGANFDDLPGSVSEKFQKYAPQFLREFVTDYLLGNYDSHSGNFIVDKNGVLRGIDKEQSMKYITDESNKKIDLSYAPNGKMAISVYNKLFHMYEKGKIDLDLKQVKQYLDRIDSVPDDEYRKIFEGYAHTKSNNTQEKNLLLDLILQRKHDARKNIEEFFINTKVNRVAKEKGITPEEVKKKIGILDSKSNVTSTQNLGRETIDEQSDTQGKNEVEQKVMNHVKILENEHNNNEGKTQ